MAYPYFVDQSYVGMMNAVNPQQQFQQPQQQQQPLQMKQILLPEEQNMLKEKGASRDGFYTPITKLEEAASRCTHKYNNGNVALGDPDEKGYRTCQICHTRFHPYEVDELTSVQVTEACEKVRNIFETIKLYKGDIEPEIGRTIYPFVTILEQIPNMYKNSVEYVKKFVGFNTNGANMYGPNISPQMMYNMLYAGAVPVYQQPAFGGYQQPVMQPGFYAQQPQPVYPQTAQPQANVAQQPAAMPSVPTQPATMPAAPQAQPGYVPYGNLTPSVVPGVPMSNPIGYVAQGVQQTAPATPQAPAAAPATAPAKEVKFEN